jgi:hypothetical protein
MTNEELAIKMESLSDIVANLAKTMNERFDQIDERFEQIDRRFKQIDEHFGSIDEQLIDMRKDHKTLVDIVKDMDLAADERFQRLKAGQEKLRADLAVVRRELYHESGSREMTDDTLYNSLDERLRRVEAKFPDLASSQAV